MWIPVSLQALGSLKEKIIDIYILIGILGFLCRIGIWTEITVIVLKKEIEVNRQKKTFLSLI